MPLYRGLQEVFGELDVSGITDTEPGHSSANHAVWDQWKVKLGANSLLAKAIDSLLLHKELNRTQLRIQLGCATGSVTNVIVALNKAGLINKNGGKISLKQL